MTKLPVNTQASSRRDVHFRPLKCLLNSAILSFGLINCSTLYAKKIQYGIYEFILLEGTFYYNRSISRDRWAQRVLRVRTYFKKIIRL